MMFKLPRGNIYTTNTTTTVAVTNDAKGNKVKLLGKDKGKFLFNKKTIHTGSQKGI